MIASLYIYAVNGFAADLISTTVPTAGLAVKRGDQMSLGVIFHDGANPVELPVDAAGSFIAKAPNGFAGDAVIQAASWTKQAAPENGYLFSVTAAGTPLDELLGAADSLALICEISWVAGGVRTTTPTVPLTILNNLTR